MGRMMRHVGDEPDDVRRAHVFPHRAQGRAAFTLVEDDGISLDYQRGGYSEVRLELVTEPHAIGLRVSREQAGYPLPYSEVEFILPPGETRPIRVEAGSEIQPGGDGRRRVLVPVRA